MTRMPLPESRPMYVAVSSTAGNFAGGFGVLLAGIILQTFERAEPLLFSGSAGWFRLLFLISFGLRLISTLIFVPRIQYGGQAQSMSVES